MTYRFPRNFTLTKAAILALLIVATQVVPQIGLSGDGTPADLMGKQAGTWHAMMEALDCPTRQGTASQSQPDQMI